MSNVRPEFDEAFVERLDQFLMDRFSEAERRRPKLSLLAGGCVERIPSVEIQGLTQDAKRTARSSQSSLPVASVSPRGWLDRGAASVRKLVWFRWLSSGR